MKIKTDLHNHLRTKKSYTDFNKVIDISQKKLGFRGILGLCNFSDSRYENFADSKGYERQEIRNAVYIPEKEILIIKGQEIPTKQGHLLVLGLEKQEHLKDNRNLEESIKESKDHNGIIIMTHPFFFNGSGGYLLKNLNLLKDVDAIEIHNGETFFCNKKAKIFYNLIFEDYNLGAVSFSDGHSLYEIGSSYTLLDFPDIKNSLRLVNSLRISIRAHKDYSKDKQNNSYLRGLDHSAKMILTGLGLRK